MGQKKAPLVGRSKVSEHLKTLTLKSLVAVKTRRLSMVAIHRIKKIDGRLFNCK